MERYDRIILGAGLYGLYSALFCAKKGEKILVLEWDEAPFKRATYINQARVHMGYHYPRSFATAIKSAGYFRRFNEDYGFCVHSKFDQVYATSANFSWTDAEAFRKFCKDAGIRCDEVAPSRYFREGMCDGAFLTEEYTYDAHILKDYFMSELKNYPGVTIKYNAHMEHIEEKGKEFYIKTGDGEYASGFVLNATYASVNQVLARLGYETFKIKYELCEIILCDVGDSLKDVGLTVMDGPFFSIMPFGRTGLHSLTSVTFTPHSVSYEEVPVFECQSRSEGHCSRGQLGNCNDCPARPDSAWDYMSGLARKYMNDKYEFTYKSSLYSMKPILKTSEIDDSRPTVIRKSSESPCFVSVLSGKINTVFDLDMILV